MVWDRRLTQDEITALFNEPRAFETEELIVYPTNRPWERKVLTLVDAPEYTQFEEKA